MYFNKTTISYYKDGDEWRPLLVFFIVPYDLNSFQLTKLPIEPVHFIPLIWMLPHLHVALPHGMETP